jgi:Glucodextranase, domain B/Bacterial TSP3 repeat
MHFLRYQVLAAAVFAIASGIDAGPVPANKPTSYPNWWFERDVIPRLPSSSNKSNPTWPLDYPAADDFAAANIGQLKKIASEAADEMNERLPAPGAGVRLNTLIASWGSSGSTVRDDYALLNQGQLKSVAEPFYVLLESAGYIGAPLASGIHRPWSAATMDDDAFAAVNLGQLKYVFSFDISNLSEYVIDDDQDELPDLWEIQYFGSIASYTEADDPDGDGVSNWDELQQGTDPFVPLGARLVITWPTEGAVIPARTVDVYGTWGAIANLHSLTLNGYPVHISSSTWRIRALPLVNGLNTLVLRAKDGKGVETTLTRAITAYFSSSDDNPVALQADVTEGAVPLTVTFTPALKVAGVVQSVTYHFDGASEASAAPTLNPASFTYQTAGTYYPVVTIKLTNGAIYSSGGQVTPVAERLTIKAGASLDTPATAWRDFTQSVIRQDFGAMSSLLGIDKRDAWIKTLIEMGPVESGKMANDISNIEEVITLQEVAQYSVTVSTSMGVLTFPINFIKEDGAWRIDEF